LDLDLLAVLEQAVGNADGLSLTVEPEHRSLDATYYDTDDLRLAQAGITLRRRTGGDDAGWHLKVPAGPDEKVEKHLSLNASRHRAPAPLRRLVRARTLGAHVRPVARIRTERSAYAITDSAGTPVAEVADDRVEATRLAEGQEVEAALVWREVEIELVEHGPVSLADLDRSVTEHGLVAASGAARSKVLRVLGDAVPRPSTSQTSPDSPAAEVVRAHVAEQVEQLRAYDPLLRLDRPDSVHKMRVATRRLRSALKTFAPVLDDERIAALREELAWLGSHLGPARDAEVMRARLEHIAQREGTDSQAGQRAQAWAGVLDREYREHHRAALRALDDERYDALLTGLVELTTSGGDIGTSGGPARKVLPGQVRRAYRALRRTVLAVDDASAAERGARDERLHEARKKAKRARYAAEALAPAYGDPAHDLAAALEQVQADLGQHQDSVVLREQLRQWARESSRDDAFLLGRWHAAEEARGAEAEERFARSWQAARKKKLRRWLR
jgi:CHAD domain-containing protein